MVMYGFFEAILVLAFSLTFAPFPVGLPPLPDDPALLRAAPADTILYMQWAGSSAPAPGDPNKAVQIASHPEILHFIERLTEAAAGLAAAEADRGMETQAARVVAYACQALRYPGCVFCGPLTREEWRRGPQDASMGLVLNVGADVAQAEQAMADLTAIVEADQHDGGTYREGEIDAGGVKFTILPGSMNDPAIAWGLVDGYLVVTLGEKSPARIVANLRGNQGLSSSQLWQSHAGKVAVARPSMRTFVDLSYFIEMLGSMDAEVPARLALLGLDSVQCLVSESGLEGDGFVSRSRLVTGSRKGVLGLFDGAPLGAADLATLPQDADLAFTTRLAPDALLNRVLAMAPDDQAREMMERQMMEGVRLAVGLDLRKDILAHMGDRVSVWNAPSQGGLLGSGLTLSWELKDAAAFDRSLEKIMEAGLRMQPRAARGERPPRGMFLEETQVGDVPMWFLNAVGVDDVPFTPAWCVADGHLLVSLYPQMLRDVLERGVRTQQSLSYPDLLVAAEGARMVGFIDWPRVFPQLYAAAHPLAAIAAAELQQERFDITQADLPRARAFTDSLTPAVLRVAATPDAFTLTRTGSMPQVDPGVVGLILGMGMIAMSGF